LLSCVTQCESLLLALCVAVLAGCTPSAESLLAKGKAAQEAGDLKTALIHLRSAAQEAPSRLDIRQALGAALQQSGEFEALEQQLRRELDLGGDKNLLAPQIAIWQNDRGEFAAVVRDWLDVTLTAPAQQTVLRSPGGLCTSGATQTPGGATAA
jgi:cellulose synthase operon protein C